MGRNIFISGVYASPYQKIVPLDTVDGKRSGGQCDCSLSPWSLSKIGRKGYLKYTVIMSHQRHNVRKAY